MRKYISEFIGTFTLVLFGCGTAVIAGGKALSQLWMFLVVPTLAGILSGILFRTKVLET